MKKLKIATMIQRWRAEIVIFSQGGGENHIFWDFS